jgi:hypothetical protein
MPLRVSLRDSSAEAAAMSLIRQLLFSLLTSAISSVLFIFTMNRLRPKLELSNKIAKTIYRDKTIYAFKVVNKGRRDAIMIKADLLIIEPITIEGGVGYNVIEVGLVRNELFLLKPIRKTRHRFGAVFEFITTEELEEWEQQYENSYMLFRVTAHDALSGFSKVFTAEYYSPSESIVEGRFAKGGSMNIGPHQALGAE